MQDFLMVFVIIIKASGLNTCNSEIEMERGEGREREKKKKIQ